jgi:putative flippase GtrA
MAFQNSKGLFQLFSYAVIGFLNTTVHWSIFLLLVAFGGMGQALANLVAFACAVTVSFFANAKITFRSQASLGRYLGYVLFLGATAWILGAGAERANLSPLVTLIGFSAISLVVGFLYSRFIIFSGERFK